MRGVQIQARSCKVWRVLRDLRRSRRLKSLERASELATAAATPSSIKRVIQRRLEAFAGTPLDYAVLRGRRAFLVLGSGFNAILRG